MFPHRSLLFMPASNARALEKAAGLPADVLIFDLEDAVAPEAKEPARKDLAYALNTHDYGKRHRLVRINALSSAWGKADAAFIQKLKIDGVMLPKVESAVDIQAVAELLPPALPVWANVETPRGIVKAEDIATHPRCTALVAGTNDLSRDLKIRRSADRTELLYALSRLVMAARTYGKKVFDGTFIDLQDKEGLEKECRQGRALGFDGKTLIHPSQIDICNAAFSPSTGEIAAAHAIKAAYEEAMGKGLAVTTVDGKMIEKLHYDDALALLELPLYIPQATD